MRTQSLSGKALALSHLAQSTRQALGWYCSEVRSLHPHLTERTNSHRVPICPLLLRPADARWFRAPWAILRDQEGALHAVYLLYLVYGVASGLARP